MEYSADVLMEPAVEGPPRRAELVGAARPLRCPGTPDPLSVLARDAPYKKNNGSRSSFQQNRMPRCSTGRPRPALATTVFLAEVAVIAPRE